MQNTSYPATYTYSLSRAVRPWKSPAGKVVISLSYRYLCVSRDRNEPRTDDRLVTNHLLLTSIVPTTRRQPIKLWPTDQDAQGQHSGLQEKPRSLYRRMVILARFSTKMRNATDQFPLRTAGGRDIQSEPILRAAKRTSHYKGEAREDNTALHIPLQNAMPEYSRFQPSRGRPSLSK